MRIANMLSPAWWEQRRTRQAVDEHNRRALKEEAERWIASEQVRHEHEMDSVAVGWVIVSKDLEFNSLYLTGPFLSEKEAAAECVRQDDQLNEMAGDQPGWDLSVHRLMPPSG